MLGLPAWFGRQHLDHLFSSKDFLHAGHHVLWLERFAVVLADVAMRHDAGLGAQVTGELASAVILDDDNTPTPAEDVVDLLGVERH